MTHYECSYCGRQRRDVSETCQGCGAAATTNRPMAGLTVRPNILEGPSANMALNQLVLTNSAASHLVFDPKTGSGPRVVNR